MTPFITSEVLYHLSYVGARRVVPRLRRGLGHQPLKTAFWDSRDSRLSSTTFDARWRSSASKRPR